VETRHYFREKGAKAEKIIHDLSMKSFFTDRCYPNPPRPDGKELCDLLVVFDDTAIIWQIKDRKVDANGRYIEFRRQTERSPDEGATDQVVFVTVTFRLSPGWSPGCSVTGLFLTGYVSSVPARVPAVSHFWGALHISCPLISSGDQTVGFVRSFVGLHVTLLPPESEGLADQVQESAAAQFARFTCIGPRFSPPVAGLPRQRILRGG
jgi:hypothetical protein